MQIISHHRITGTCNCAEHSFKDTVTLLPLIDWPVWNSPLHSLFFCSAEHLTLFSCPNEWVLLRLSCLTCGIKCPFLTRLNSRIAWREVQLLLLKTAQWQVYLLYSPFQFTQHGQSHTDKRLCSRKCHKHQVPLVGTILTHCSQREQNLFFCIQVTRFQSAAGVYWL